LRKRAKEIYPAPAFLAMCVEAGVPVALSSDAHLPADVGSSYEQALALLESVGVDQLCCFTARKRSLQEIGASVA
jgi:histidinol-phosphatase (PHP family)